VGKSRDTYLEKLRTGWQVHNNKERREQVN